MDARAKKKMTPFPAPAAAQMRATGMQMSRMFSFDPRNSAFAACFQSPTGAMTGGRRREGVAGGDEMSGAASDALTAASCTRAAPPCVSVRLQHVGRRTRREATVPAQPLCGPRATRRWGLSARRKQRAAKWLRV